MYFCIDISRFDLFIILTSKTMLLPNKLKELLEQCELPQRKVAAALDIDTATYCKIENGNYSPRKEQVIQLADILQADKDELVKFWLADKITIVAESEKDFATEALKLVNENYKRI